MATNWYYSRGGQQHGPFTAADIKVKAEAGEFGPTDLVWKDGMADWEPASKVKGLFAEPSRIPTPPPPPVRSGTAVATPSAPPPVRAPAVRPQIDRDTVMIWSYRVALLLAAVFVFFPWITWGGETSFDGDRIPGMTNLRRTARMYGQPSQQYVVNERAAVSILGITTLSGTLTLFVALAGVVVSFLRPSQFLKQRAKFGMAAVGVGVVIMCLIAVFTASWHSPMQFNFRDEFGNYMRSSVGATFGLYLSLLSGVGAAALGFFCPWDRTDFS